MSFTQSSAVWYVALCSEDGKVAIGLQNGTVKVLDSGTGDTVFEDTEAHSDGCDVYCVQFGWRTHGYMLVGQNYSRVGC